MGSSTLLSSAFRLSDNAQAIVTRTAATLLGEARFVLGAHFRAKMYDWESDQVPDISVDMFLDCVDEVFRLLAPTDGGGDAVIFLASPSDGAKLQALKRFGHKLVTREVIT